MSTEPLQIKWKLFRPWLESKGDNHTYEYGDGRNCLICQFVKETTGNEILAGGTEIGLIGDSASVLIPQEIAYALVSTPRTVGQVKKALDDPKSKIESFRSEVYER